MKKFFVSIFILGLAFGQNQASAEGDMSLSFTLQPTTAYYLVETGSILKEGSQPILLNLEGVIGEVYASITDISEVRGEDLETDFDFGICKNFLGADIEAGLAYLMIHDATMPDFIYPHIKAEKKIYADNVFAIANLTSYVGTMTKPDALVSGSEVLGAVGLKFRLNDFFIKEAAFDNSVTFVYDGGGLGSEGGTLLHYSMSYSFNGVAGLSFVAPKVDIYEPMNASSMKLLMVASLGITYTLK